ncbi:hypothetical protein Y032_0070g431 [Ancylostoma ceylanicum]|uniref:Sphingomyelin phosphodiesterase n=1 Tax=Ancylostoma ceylanicum TaxID=53326 RepID=A0A016TWL1_9BILA|nr:hypothetical protein Y032_0070g431 [Ancylostoma ceylanicum]
MFYQILLPKNFDVKPRDLRAEKNIISYIEATGSSLDNTWITMNAWQLAVAALLCIVLCTDCHSIRNKSPRPRTPEIPSADSVKFSPLCASCTAAMSALSLVVKWDKTEPVILEFATIICKLVAKQSWVVCDGISGQFRDEFFYVFRRLSDESPAKICGLLLNECADPDDVTQSGWMVDLPPKLTPIMKRRIEKKRVKHTHPKNGRNRNLRVLQLTDLHVDFDYKPGSEADCDLPVCCREEIQSPKKAAGYWGAVGKCDIPYWTFKNMLEHINATHEIDYIMLSGDFINHFDWSYTVDEHVDTLRNLSSLVRRYFLTTPTYWAIGNHEGVPVNSFAPHFVEERFWPTWLYNEFVNMSKPWLSSDSAKTVLYRGSYSVKVADGLRLISLNSGFCETTNFFLYLNQSDPDGTMSWFATELFKAELSGDDVHVLSHIPPGDGECLEGWARNYYRIIQRFSDTVQAQFFGHIHADYFTVFYEDMHNTSSAPIGVLYAAPSATTFSDMNPAYRIYDIDYTDHFKVVDIANYYADLDKTSKDIPPAWKLLYSAKKEYGLRNLSPQSWNKLVDSIVTNEKMAQRFFRNAFRVGEPACGVDCQRDLLCSLRMGHHNSTLYCPSSFAQAPATNFEFGSGSHR